MPHAPDYLLLCRIAGRLGLPVSSFFSDPDAAAVTPLRVSDRQDLLDQLAVMTDSDRWRLIDIATAMVERRRGHTDHGEEHLSKN